MARYASAQATFGPETAAAKPNRLALAFAGLAWQASTQSPYTPTFVA